MGFISNLYKAPEVNPLNNKALSIPILNPVNKYGRTFHLAWFGFFVAFLSWFAFAPLLTVTLKTDLHLTQAEIQNSNILGLTSTLVVRVFIGPICDRFGPRKAMAGCLLAGAIPTAMAGLVTNAKGLIAIRFFIGILGGSFVPCQVWVTGWYDKSVVGRANALAGGWGNSGGGVTYFVMPAVFEALVRDGYTAHKAWRISFAVCPFVIIVATAIMIITLGQDTPTGNWSERFNTVAPVDGHKPNVGTVVDVPSDASYDMTHFAASSSTGANSGTATPTKEGKHAGIVTPPKAELAPVEELAREEVIVKPTLSSTLRTIASMQTMLTALCYFTTFGAETTIEGNLGSFYKAAAPSWSQSMAGNWAAMFMLLNIVTRPCGGYIADVLYRVSRHDPAVKKYFMATLGLLEGAFLLWIGLQRSMSISTLIGAHAAAAVFLEAANGANYALVPHIHPSHNGVVSGITGAMGNFGGVMFSLILRYRTHVVNGAVATDYHTGYWIIAIIVLIINACAFFVPLNSGERRLEEEAFKENGYHDQISKV
ncbi:nitrate transporter [Saitoella complicata NRRL Y-17804]|uniref:Nitrate/nitrite transporter n=1 Tax=Saitoella complicata (strain BCRC 22490 / CBS 7301 / JCM 7358 / NBRC 10748 / NRRL Y-17804) TaxID=698492 RepID=A0A0E9NCH7_SAICN|nr:nitrate transporter [Saitoella complicata NRRL Y-17804]ODQ51652.1 nitrate transporter [Saitoella complicata NRRL Y-17804]GAO47401.1 hypothetical protein G7K_1609-t1 [Saitoella complicata NRRL Y-17804]